MEVSRVSLELSSKDIISIVNEYIKIPALTINNVILEEKINAIGSYKLGGRFNFDATVCINGIKEDIIALRIETLKVGKLKIFNWIKNIGVKKLLNELSNFGISYEKDVIHIDYKVILRKLPFHLDCNIRNLELRQERIMVQVENICFSMNKGYVQNIEYEIKDKDVEIHKSIVEPLCICKVQDPYTKIRETVEEQVPDKYDKLLEYALILPDIISLFYRLFKDKRVPLKTKLLVGSVITYLASPLDIIPDFIPFIGKVDDIALALFALNKIINDIPNYIILENWQGELDIILKVKQGVRYIYTMTGGSNVAKLFSVIERFWTVAREDDKITFEKEESEK